MPIKSVKMKISKNKKNRVFFSHVPRIIQLKIYSQVKRCALQPADKNLLVLYKEKKSKNAYKKRKNENFKKQKNAFLSHVPRIIQPKSFLGQKLCSVARLHTDTQTHRHTHTKVTTVGTLSGFQEFFLQPIIKDRPNNWNPLILLPKEAHINILVVK